jgi:prepilin-type N-terminal cleavage/methylation domain-containing protein
MTMTTTIPTDPGGRELGFTLLETLVALVIVATGFGFAFTALPASLGADGSARNLEAATSLAQSVLDQAGEIPADGAEAGFAWHIADATLPGGTRPGADFGGRVIQVTVSWPEGGHTRSIGVQTVKLARIARTP